MCLAFPGPLGLAYEAGFGAFLTRLQSRCRAAQGFSEISGRKSALGIDKPLCDQAGEEYVMERADGFCCATTAENWVHSTTKAGAERVAL